jgi:hypothetical protein
MSPSSLSHPASTIDAKSTSATRARRAGETKATIILDAASESLCANDDQNW